MSMNLLDKRSTLDKTINETTHFGEGSRFFISFRRKDEYKYLFFPNKNLSTNLVSKSSKDAPMMDKTTNELNVKEKY